MKMIHHCTLKKALATFLGIALFLCGLPIQYAFAQQDNTETTDYGLKNPTLDNRVGTWDCIYFGNYWQNDTNNDGNADKNDEKEPIKWRVLSVNGDDAFLISDQILELRVCDNLNTENFTWEKSTMRSWLNGYGAAENSAGEDYTNDNFLNDAFNETERESILATLADNQLPGDFSSEECGNDTTDKVYLLSRGEAVRTSLGFESRHMSSKTRVTAATAYAAGKGLVMGWWLRSKGTNGKNYAVTVGESDDGIGGYVYRTGETVGTLNYGVRPVLHLNLANHSVWSHAKSINSDGQEFEWVSPAPAETASPAPTETSSQIPAETPSPVPTESPSPVPTVSASPAPTQTPSPVPTQTPSPAPTETASPVPTESPSPVPTQTANPAPSETPSPAPAETASPAPTQTPSTVPSETASPAPTQTAPQKQKVKTVGSLKYAINASKSKKTAEVCGVKKKNTKTIRIPNKIKIDGKTYQVTAIQKNSFSSMRKLSKVTIGQNVSIIGDSAFKNCKKLCNIIVKTNKLQSVGAKAFQGISPKTKVKTPKKKRAQYEKMFRGTGKLPKKAVFIN